MAPGAEAAGTLIQSVLAEPTPTPTRTVTRGAAAVTPVVVVVAGPNAGCAIFMKSGAAVAAPWTLVLVLDMVEA